jgi:hypothetical protein
VAEHGEHLDIHDKNTQYGKTAQHIEGIDAL